MFGDSGPLLIALALAVALALALLALFGGMAGVTRLATRRFWCPFRARNVSVEFREAAWDGQRVDVSRCSAFSPPTAITCGKRCVLLDRLPRERAQGRAA
jgi:hypothetical protein